MDSQGLLVAFSLLSCLGAGMLFFQGLQAARYRGERANKPVAALAVVLAVAAVACFAARMGHWERIFGAFGNVTSGITLLLYAAVLCAVGALIVLVLSFRSEDGSVPAWSGVVAAVVAVVLMVCTAFGNYYYLRLDNLTPDFFALAFLYATSALALGSLAALVAAGAAGDADALGFARKAVLPCVLLHVVAVVVFLLFFQLDAAATAVASKSSYSMTSYNMNFATSSGAAAAAEADDVVSLVLTGANAPLFWGGAVAAGLVVPALCGAFAFVRGKAAAGRTLAAVGAVGLVCALAGGAALRLVLGVLGV